MKFFASILALAVVATAQEDSVVRLVQDNRVARVLQQRVLVNQDRSDLSQPTPYEYSYTSENEEGSHGHSEKFDGTSRAEGNYFLKLADGRERHVTYYADETGFHPEIQTNELGTESKNSGDTVYISSALSGPDAAIQAYGGPFPEQVTSGIRPVGSERPQVVRLPGVRVVGASPLPQSES